MQTMRGCQTQPTCYIK